MADPVTVLIVLSAAMFLGSYLAGSIPLLFTMSESRIRVFSIFGAGLLIGTALCVIIPEGVESLYSSQIRHSEDHHHDAAAVAQVNANAPLEVKSILEGDGARTQNQDSPRIIPKDAQLNEGINRERVKRHAGSEHSHSHSASSPIHTQIGLSLVVGFVFMLLVDQISNFAMARSGRHRIGFSATVGLVVHAAADGVALGGASSISRTDVQMIVFVAIMLHKGPASFGLVSFLLMEGLDKRTTRKHLIIFSASAPIAAIFTFFCLGSLTNTTITHNDPTTGILMLFSAGTFLYVATVHVLPELASTSKNTNYELMVMDIQTPSTLRHTHNGVSFTMQMADAIIQEDVRCQMRLDALEGPTARKVAVGSLMAAVLLLAFSILCCFVFCIARRRTRAAIANAKKGKGKKKSKAAETTSVSVEESQVCSDELLTHS